MIPLFYFLAIWFVGYKNNRNLNNFFQKLLCSPSKVPISIRIILRNTSKRSRMFYQLLVTQNVQISIIFLSVKYIVIRIKKMVSCIFNLKYLCQNLIKLHKQGVWNCQNQQIQNWHWFWKFAKIWGSNRAKQNKTNLWSLLYKQLQLCLL